MSKFAPLLKLHKLVQLTHSANGKAVFYSQVNLNMDDLVDEDEAGGWILSTFTGKNYFEREYRREDLDNLLTASGDANWEAFSVRFKKAILEGYFHMMCPNARECTVIIDNNVQSRSAGSGDANSKLVEINVEMYPVNHANRNEKLGEFVFECASFVQTRGCILSAGHTTQSGKGHDGSFSAVATPGQGSTGKSYEVLKEERDRYKSENEALKLELEKLRASHLASQNPALGGLAASSGRPKSKSGQKAMLMNANLLKKRKLVSVLNPRVKKHVIAKGTEFDSDEEDENEQE
ncbi:hypothetical protein BGZ94_008857 [Podila epigama]|nr:hypothetical protein BGZ94_008857 [Podila epigama]